MKKKYSNFQIRNNSIQPKLYDRNFPILEDDELTNDLKLNDFNESYAVSIWKGEQPSEHIGYDLGSSDFGLETVLNQKYRYYKPRPSKVKKKMSYTDTKKALFDNKSINAGYLKKLEKANESSLLLLVKSITIEEPQSTIITKPVK